MSSKMPIDKKYLNLKNFKQISCDINYSISEFGIIYNKSTEKFKRPTFHKNILQHFVILNKTQHLIKNLMYTNFIDPNFQVNTKTYIQINKSKDDAELPFLNFTINDLEEVSKSEAIKKQARNCRIINKYDLNMNFIRSYTNKADILAEFQIKDPKPITKCLAGSRDEYRGFVFKYDDVDNIKNSTEKLEKIKIQLKNWKK